VDIDTARPEGSTGMVDAILALSFDPKTFDVSAADVQLGAVLASGSGWRFDAEVNSQTGLIGVELWSPTPIASGAGGSLVTIAMHPRQMVDGGRWMVDNAMPPLTIVPFADPLGGSHVYRTSVADAQGEFVVHFASQSEIRSRGIESGAKTSALFDTPLRTTDSGLAQQSVQEIAGTVYDPVPLEVLPSEIRDLAILQETSPGGELEEWLTEDQLAYLAHVALTASARFKGPLDDPIDDLGSDELEKVEAFFTRTADY
jgi:hypothetical protein